MNSKNLLIALLLIASNKASAQGDAKKEFSLDDMIITINNSILKANETLGAGTVNVQSAEITLQTIHDKTGGGGFKLFVKASRNWELEKASSVTYEFAKDSMKSAARSKWFDNQEINEKNLIEAIVSAANQWHKTQSTIEGLEKSSFKIEISFAVTKITGTGIEFEVWGVGVDAGVNFKKRAVHSISLSFE